MDLKDIRRIKKLSQQDVSDILDISKRTIEDWETGKRKAPDYVLNLISDKLLNMTKKEIEEEKAYCVIEHSKSTGSKIIFVGDRNDCLNLEDEKRKTYPRAATHDQLFNRKIQEIFTGIRLL